MERHIMTDEWEVPGRAKMDPGAHSTYPQEPWEARHKLQKGYSKNG